MLALALILATSPLAESRGPSEYSIPATVRSEATAPSASADGVPLDKLLHASISANLVLGFAAIAHAFGAPDWLALAVGAGVSLAFGVVRELVGNRDPLDMAANGLGVGAGVVVSGLLLGGTF